MDSHVRELKGKLFLAINNQPVIEADFFPPYEDSRQDLIRSLANKAQQRKLRQSDCRLSLDISTHPSYKYSQNLPQAAREFDMYYKEYAETNLL